MSGAPVNRPVRDRFECLSDLLRAIRTEDDIIRTGSPIDRDEAMVRQHRKLGDLILLSRPMTQRGDFVVIDLLLAGDRSAA